MQTETDLGKAWVFGDDVNTDYIISSKRKRDTLDTKILANYLMEDIRPGFGKNVKPGDFLIGGSNFGCGSAMEIATEVIKGAGVGAVLAKSFSRTFFRNGINGGLLMIVMETDAINEGDRLSVTQDSGSIIVTNHSRNTNQRISGSAAALSAIVIDGGLIEHLKRNGGFALTKPSMRDTP